MNLRQQKWRSLAAPRLKFEPADDQALRNNLVKPQHEVDSLAPCTPLNPCRENCVAKFFEYFRLMTVSSGPKVPILLE